MIIDIARHENSSITYIFFLLEKKFLYSCNWIVAFCHNDYPDHLYPVAIDDFENLGSQNDHQHSSKNSKPDINN